MRRIILLIFLSIIPYVLLSQVIVKNEGLVVNNTVTGTWEGINISRAVRTSLTFVNNSITSVNSAGYLLQAGDESPLSTNNNLDGEIITGNKFVWNGTDATSITHGLFVGYNINSIVKYNYLDKVPYGIIFKSGNDGGVNMTFTSGGCAYNIHKNGKFAVRIKGINGIPIYNNTFYNDIFNGSWYLVLVTQNMDRTLGSPSLGIKIKNNIFYTKNPVPSISIESGSFADFESDYNVFYCENSENHEPIFLIDGVKKTWSQWRDLGYDTHSVIVNPNFNNTTDFVPGTRLNYGTDLGTAWQIGLSTSAVWNVGSAPATANQNGKWQVGAVIYPEVAVTTLPVVNTPPVVLINFPSENLSGFVGELDATRSYDTNNDNLTYTWLTPSNVSVSSTNSAKIRFLSPVVNTSQKIEFTLNVSDGKTTQSKTIPIKIIPYKPELEFAEVTNIEASSFQSPYYPYNILDGNIGTMWSANGDEQWLIIELKELFSIQHVKIAFQPGQKTESYFDVFGSQDKETWEPILTKSASCGFSGDLQVFDFPASKSLVEYKYIKLVGHANSADSWNHISEFKVFGYRHRNPGSYEELPIKLYPNPAHESFNIRIDDSTLGINFIRIITVTGKVVFEDKMDPEIKDLKIPITSKQGIYIVQMGSGDLTLFTQKLVVNI